MGGDWCGASQSNCNTCGGRWCETAANNNDNGGETTDPPATLPEFPAEKTCMVNGKIRRGDLIREEIVDNSDYQGIQRCSDLCTAQTDPKCKYFNFQAKKGKCQLLSTKGPTEKNRYYDTGSRGCNQDGENGYPYMQSEFWGHCAAREFKAKGKSVGKIASKATAHECALLCRDTKKCAFWMYDASKGKCVALKANRKTVDFAHGDVGSDGRKFLSGYKECEYMQWANI